jgi:hypothetical protein
VEAHHFKRTVGCPVHRPFLGGVSMLKNKILVEILLVHFVYFERVYQVNDLADAVDGLTVVDSYTVSHPSP